MLRVGVDFGGTKIEAAVLGDGRRVPRAGAGAESRQLRRGDPRRAVNSSQAAEARGGRARHGRRRYARFVVAPHRRDPQRQFHSTSTAARFRADLAQRARRARSAWPTTRTAWPLSRGLRWCGRRRAARCSRRSSAPAAAAASWSTGGCVEGANGIGGEWGHVPLPWPSAGRTRRSSACWCGQRGCLETWISGRGLRARSRCASGGPAGGATAACPADRRRGAARAMRQRANPVRALSRPAGARSRDDRQSVRSRRARAWAAGMSNVTELYARLPTLSARPDLRGHLGGAAACRRAGATRPASAAPRVSGSRFARGASRVRRLDQSQELPPRSTNCGAATGRPSAPRKVVAQADSDAARVEVERARPSLDQAVVDAHRGARVHDQPPAAGAHSHVGDRRACSRVRQRCRRRVRRVRRPAACGFSPALQTNGTLTRRRCRASLGGRRRRGGGRGACAARRRRAFDAEAGALDLLHATLRIAHHGAPEAASGTDARSGCRRRPAGGVPAAECLPAPRSPCSEACAASCVSARYAASVAGSPCSGRHRSAARAARAAAGRERGRAPRAAAAASQVDGG